MINKGLKVPAAIHCDLQFCAEMRQFCRLPGRTAAFLQQVAQTIELRADLPWKKRILLANWNYRKRVEA
jgi:hypothetical protein